MIDRDMKRKIEEIETMVLAFLFAILAAVGVMLWSASQAADCKTRQVDNTPGVKDQTQTVVRVCKG